MKNFLAIRGGTMESTGSVEMGLRFARLWDAIKGEPLRQFEACNDLLQRAITITNESSELGIRSTARSFGNIQWDRGRGLTKLRRQVVPLRVREAGH